MKQVLSKPTNPTPYMVAVDPRNDMTFKASCLNANEVTRVRLCIHSNNCQYFFPIPIDSYTKENDEVAINIATNTQYSGYKIRTFAKRPNIPISGRDNITQYICGNKSDVLLTTSKDYRWQMRLYQNENLVNIGYGFIQAVYDVSSYTNNPSSASNKKFSASTTHILKVRPHTNMFFNASGGGLFYVNSTLDQSYVDYYDDNVKYTININGTSYDVLAYYYGSASSGLTLEKDSYGNPLFAYIEVKASKGGISADDEYSIYTNYIDSNEFYFPCRSNPNLTLSDCLGQRINAFANGETPTEDNVISIDYSDFILKGSYSQSDGATINYYRIVIYQVLPTHDEILVEDTGNIYSSEINYSYDKFLYGGTYKLILQATDTNKNSILKSVYIKPNYPGEVVSDNLQLDYYKDHGSVILDFGDITSISCREHIDGAHSFEKIIVDENGAILDDSMAWELISGKLTKVNVCTVNNDNYLTYSNIDGTDKSFSCDNPLLSIVVKGLGTTTSGTQDIFTFVADDGNYSCSLSWKNRYFDFTYRIFKTSYSKRYYPFSNKGFTSNSVEQDCAITIASEIKSDKLNYTVPYLALPDIVIDDTDKAYWHTEDIFNDFWWQIIFTKNYLYIKCLNSSRAGYRWEFETRW